MENHWNYPLFLQMSLVQIVLFLAALSFLSIGSYFVGEALTYFVWGKWNQLYFNSKGIRQLGSAVIFLNSVAFFTF